MSAVQDRLARAGLSVPDLVPPVAAYVPAKLDDALAESVREHAVRVFRTMDCSGLARVDFFVTDDGSVLVNELNTMPGFTATSLYPRVWATTGFDYPTLLTTLVDTALAQGTGVR